MSRSLNLGRVSTAVMLAVCTIILGSGWLACGEADLVCVPGRQELCVCSGGVASFQVCLADGSGFGACNCGAGGGGSGGTGPSSCTSVSDCFGTNSDCEEAVCSGGVCDLVPLPAGPLEWDQTEHDCRERVCDGTGDVVDKVDEFDAPTISELQPGLMPCGEVFCLEGFPVKDVPPIGTMCGMNFGRCDGGNWCVPCMGAGDCGEQPHDSECGTRLCYGDLCEVDSATAGTYTALQLGGPCQFEICDGTGGFAQIMNNTDLPNDNLVCTTDTCSNGSPIFTVNQGGPCLGIGTCDSNGYCVGCTTSANCGVDTACLTWSCAQGTCVPSYVAANTLVGQDDPTDCRDTACDGLGNEIILADDGEIPVSDNNECTQDVCFHGDAYYDVMPLATPCGQGQFCDEAGSCVDCNGASQCPQSTVECATASCNGSVCFIENSVPGTVLSAQTPGDCLVRRCGGNGAVVSETSIGDMPDDTNECTLDRCNGGMPEHLPLPAGTPCSVGAKVCDGQGNCT